jgi:threonyl-tRNA synthetase
VIEHYAGAFPLWLAPVQISLIPIAERHNEAAQTMAQKRRRRRFRVEINDKNESMQAKIREATLQKVPYMGIIGDKEVSTETVSVRTRKGEDLKSMTLDEFLNRLQNELETNA